MTSIPLIEPKAPITEALIRHLVHSFYARIRQDEELGPIFNRVIGGNWDKHLATMVDFWSSVSLGTGRYTGKPHAAHRNLGLSPEHFERWLEIFRQTALDVCPEAADFFLDRANRIADSLQIGLNIGPKALNLPGNAPKSQAAS